MSSEDFEMAPMTFPGHQSYDEKVAEKFNQLSSLNVNDKTEQKNGLTYLSWSNAWLEFKKVYPTATYNVVKNPQTGLPYFVDPAVGIMVFTEVEANGLKYSMWLPVMDGANKAMKTEAYTYPVWNKTTRQYENRKVEAATMFDINKAIMRCLTKCLAMHGLGIYLYNGEDMPETVESSTEAPQQNATPVKTRKRKSNDPYAGIKAAINATNSTQELTDLYRQHENEVKGNPQILALFTTRKQQLLNAA
ncbi:Sak single strand annealing protein [Prevotella sp.]|uniref:Sak single strand annealing protein n=1 Tax=Prevotella sp. TaxID=59823 RepID=UPI003AB98226